MVRVIAGAGAGSGTVIRAAQRRGWVLSAAHVVHGSRRCRILFADHAAAEAELVAADRVLDLALLSIDTMPAGAATIPVASDRQWPRRGDWVELIGYGGGRLRHWRAKVNGYALTGDTGRHQTLSVATQTIGGDSGGAIVFRGRLVGVIWGGPLAGPRGPMLATHGTCCVAIQAFLRRVTPTAPPNATPAPVVTGPVCGDGSCPWISVPPSCVPSRPPAIDRDLRELFRRLERLQQQIDRLQHRPQPVVPIDQIVDRLLEQMAVDERFRGPPGEDGRPGRDGEDGRDARVDLDRLAEQVKQRISGSIRIRVEPVKP